MDFALSIERDFSLEKIMANRPLLFFLDKKPERTVRLDDCIVRIALEQKDGKIIVTYDKELSVEQLHALHTRLEFCLGTKESMEEFYLLIYDDPVFQPLHNKIHGTRLISAYDDFEAIVCLLCYQNMPYDEYLSSIQKLVDSVGRGVFPSPDDILTRKSLLARCGLKGKEEVVVSVATLFKEKKVVTEEQLVRIPGLGDATIELYLLHQRRDYSHYYLDSFTKRIVRTYYGTQFEKDIEVKNFLKKKFNTYTGLAVLYLRKLMSEQLSAHYG